MGAVHWMAGKCVGLHGQICSVVAGQAGSNPLERGCAAIAGHVEMQRYGAAGTAEGLEHVVSMLGGP